MSPEHVLVEQHDEVVVLRLHRPPANAFCLELANDFAAAFETDAVKRAKALVLTGSGKFFSGGLEIGGAAVCGDLFEADCQGFCLEIEAFIQGFNGLGELSCFSQGKGEGIKFFLTVFGLFEPFDGLVVFACYQQADAVCEGGLRAGLRQILFQLLAECQQVCFARIDIG